MQFKLIFQRSHPKKKQKSKRAYEHEPHLICHAIIHNYTKFHVPHIPSFQDLTLQEKREKLVWTYSHISHFPSST